MQKKKSKNLAKLPVKRYLLYICIALFLLTGVTFSKYITVANGSDSARVAKFGEVTLYETENDEQVYSKNFIYTPGVDIAKDPTVNFSAAETSAYVFVTVSASDWTFNSADKSYTVGNKINWSVDNNWTFVKTDGESQVFCKFVEANSSLDSVPIIKNNTVSVSENLKNSEMEIMAQITLNLTFKACAVQAGGFTNADEAWESVSSK